MRIRPYFVKFGLIFAQLLCFHQQEVCFSLYAEIRTLYVSMMQWPSAMRLMRGIEIVRTGRMPL